MTPLSILLRREIESSGPIPFDRFMETALYHPQSGYYRRGDVFGKSGDFYTAEQIQPVFGLLMATFVRSLRDEMRARDSFQVVELGAGRGEMADAFSAFEYVPVEWDRAALPERIRGVVFANEFFDALPVRVFLWRKKVWREMLVGNGDDGFVWVEGNVPDARAARYLNLYTDPAEDNMLVEVNLQALEWLKRIAQRLAAGYLIVIDYGYTRREMVRFPQGTLMTYHRHTASPSVLYDPGSRDITAHVNFTALEQHAARLGLECIRFESLSNTLLRIGEADDFAAALTAGDPVEQTRRRLQLKTLLFGMGETFRALLLKVGTK